MFVMFECPQVYFFKAGSRSAEGYCTPTLKSVFSLGMCYGEIWKRTFLLSLTSFIWVCFLSPSVTPRRYCIPAYLMLMITINVIHLMLMKTINDVYYLFNVNDNCRQHPLLMSSLCCYLCRMIMSGSSGTDRYTNIIE